MSDCICRAGGKEGDYTHSNYCPVWKDRRITELEEDKERLLLMEEHAVQSFNELTRKHEAVEQQLAALREALKAIATGDMDILPEQMAHDALQESTDG